MLLFKNCAPFIDCISEINNTQVDNAKEIDIVIPMQNLIEYSDNYFEIQEVYCNTIEMNRFQIIIVLIKIRVPVKYLSNFQRTLELP